MSIDPSSIIPLTLNNTLRFREGGRVTTSSLKVAEVFGKRHADVLRAVDSAMKTLSEIDPEFNERNFAFVEYVDEKGETHRAFDLTKDGFTYMAMSFTGKKAVQFKVAYIKAFNAMAEHLTAYEDWRKDLETRRVVTAENVLALEHRKANLAEKRAEIRRIEAQNKARELTYKEEKMRENAYREEVRQALRSGKGLAYANARFWGLDAVERLPH